MRLTQRGACAQSAQGSSRRNGASDQMQFRKTARGAVGVGGSRRGKSGSREVVATPGGEIKQVKENKFKGHHELRVTKICSVTWLSQHGLLLLPYSEVYCKAYLCFPAAF